jgi:hypothetical protein
MVPFLAPLLGSMAASLLPATFGTGVAGALGLSGAAGGLIAAAAPKALGAGIGTLLAGGDLGDAALNAVGFGAGSTALSSMMGNAPGAATSAAGATNAGDAIKALTQTAVGQPQAAPAPAAEPQAAPARMMMENALDTFKPRDQTSAGLGLPADAVNQIASVRVPTGGSSIMPASLGIGSLPGMNNDTMLASFSPDQRNMINGYLGSQGTIGFA